jgi:hypothetical protein
MGGVMNLETEMGWVILGFLVWLLLITPYMILFEASKRFDEEANNNDSI